MAVAARRTALDVLRRSADGDTLELWLEYRTESTQSDLRARLYYLDDGSQYVVTDWFLLPHTALDEFHPFVEPRAGHIHLDRCEEPHITECLGGVNLPLVIGGHPL